MMKKRLFIRVIRLAPCAIRDIRDPRASSSFWLVAATLRRVYQWLKMPLPFFFFPESVKICAIGGSRNPSVAV
jgi:hypothetical protein